MESYLQKRSAKKHTHHYIVDSETSDTVCLHCGKGKGDKRAEPGKYNAITCIYNGFVYDSKFEAQYAMQLDWRLKAGDIISWERQFPIRIKYRNETICTLWVDFRVHHNDDSYELVETKGFETEAFRLKKRLLEIIWLPDHLDHRYTLLK